jgi:uncharacterized protein (DUF2147 family)
MIAATARAESPEGNWLTQDRDGIIAISRCPEGLCGRIVGLAETIGPDGAVSADPQGRPMCGLDILVAAPGEPGTWDGRITDPDTGTAWTCRLRLDAAGRLQLRGYAVLPLFGRTQIWTRTTIVPRPDCAMPGSGDTGPGATLRQSAGR